MMSFVFDLISDLHVDTWDENNWEGIATSPVCVVAGDVSKDRAQVVDTLRRLGKTYQAVFYIDGNDEHQAYLGNLGYSYADLVGKINKIPNLVYLQDNVVVIDGVAIIGTNGWWGFDFDLSVDGLASAEWYKEKFSLSNEAIKAISKMATNDAMYLINSVKRLQTHLDVNKIVIVTHTVPNAALISHDIDLEGKLKFNTMGNRYMDQVLDADTENKIHTWCFGHYHGSVDQHKNNIRYVNNCRGRGDTPYKKYVYHPLRVVIDY
jgi:UDP-2,3-diacylglucosamine pyrophosphatase LpxH